MFSLPLSPTESVYLILAILWVLPWKGVALWKAARRKDTKWFIALLLINTAGILEILYIFIFSKKKSEVFDKESKESLREDFGTKTPLASPQPEESESGKNENQPEIVSEKYSREPKMIFAHPSAKARTKRKTVGRKPRIAKGKRSE